MVAISTGSCSGAKHFMISPRVRSAAARAQEFAVCDNWHASMPGPTWPNRMFGHAASSGGLDHSPTTEEIVEWETIGGFQFKSGSIFDALKKKGLSRRLYAFESVGLTSRQSIDLR
jgi:phospholipase C